jgi:Ser/Thr protein kinase RdoA (MazF antagonist)
MNVPSQLNDEDGVVAAAVKAFQLGTLLEAHPLGGTATPKFVIRTSRGKFVVRVRAPEFANESFTRFDHEALTRLAAAGLPVPCPRQQPDGTSQLTIRGQKVEVLSWVEGSRLQDVSRETAANVGRFLNRFHNAFEGHIPTGKEGFQREDHPDLLLPYVHALTALCQNATESAAIKRIGGQIELVRRNLDDRLWPQLPRAITHGDLHPGNLLFHDSEIAAVFDFDYLSEQARVHDIVHALIFFAAHRNAHLNVDDIESLTQPFVLDSKLSRELLNHYQADTKLQAAEWEAMPWVMRSQWLQYRLRGNRKVPQERKVAFVLNRFFDVIDWLDRDSQQFFARLQMT